MIIDTALLQKSKIVNAPEDASAYGVIFIRKSFFQNNRSKRWTITKLGFSI